ncbi:hypothetical protein BOW53_10240 [Solemya pervernicosa gill symbiont]|uniref:Uncharacterized protein n=1 Tax=Solemya pervernicosa gill symbiont TaxID=642797 RepID=A0A1T2L3R8_9GAMM|nr:hypothetical protein BOW53_10240 [Solemya pervernicosa gill symbiont]
MAWKLAFLKLVLPNESGSYHPLKPIDKTWLRSGFENFCCKLAKRESLMLPKEIDWFEAERAGWQRQGEVMRLSLLRHAVRRAVELWLVLDAVTFLQANGYEVRLGSFCSREITPRNILISARRGKSQMIRSAALTG